MAEFCPHCGFNITPDTELVRGDWRLTTSEAFCGGIRQPITALEANILHTLARAEGRPVKAETIGFRVTDCDDPAGLVRVKVRHLRAKLGADCPIKTIFREGYHWAAPVHADTPA